MALANRTYYSFDVTPSVHFVMLDTESILDTSDISPAEAAWLAGDLAAAAGATWRLAAGHRPLYCTNGGYGSSNKDCGGFAANLRAQAEAVLSRGHVDLVTTAHMHGYERTQPVLDGKVTPAAAGGIVYIVNGAGGNRESNDDPRGNAPWSAPTAAPPAQTHTATIGYGIMTIVAGAAPGASSLKYEFYESATGVLIDSMTLAK